MFIIKCRQFFVLPAVSFFLVSFVQWCLNPHGLFNAKAILEEEQLWYYLTHRWWGLGSSNLPHGYTSKSGHNCWNAIWTCSLISQSSTIATSPLSIMICYIVKKPTSVFACLLNIVASLAFVTSILSIILAVPFDTVWYRIKTKKSINRKYTDLIRVDLAN